MNLEQIIDRSKLYLKQLAVLKGYDIALEACQGASKLLRSHYISYGAIVFSSLALFTSIGSISVFGLTREMLWLQVSGVMATLFILSFVYFLRLSSTASILKSSGLARILTKTQEALIEEQEKKDYSHKDRELEARMSRLENVLEKQNNALEHIVSNIESSYQKRYDDGKERSLNNTAG